MKLAAEDKLKPFPETFFDVNVEHNYFAQNVSPYIKEVFEKGKLANGASWADYAAGYMWGTTGFVFNPEKIDRSIMTSWNCLTSKACERKITAKDNVRDSYFMGLGMYYEDELLQLQNNQSITDAEYKKILSEKMNDTSKATMGEAKKLLEKASAAGYFYDSGAGHLHRYPRCQRLWQIHVAFHPIRCAKCRRRRISMGWAGSFA